MAFRVIEELNELGFVEPNYDQLVKLADIVRTLAPWVDAFSDAGFGRALLATGVMFRTADTDRSLAWHSHVSHVNDVLETFGLGAVSGPSVLAACLAHCDILYRRHDGNEGQLLEVGLSRWGPGGNCQNEWRKLLAGGPLRAPLPPRPMPGHPAGLPTFSVY